jgi:creatinine amidohydrolase
MVSVSIWLEKLTWIEAEKAFKKYNLVVIPLGARTKEHGPHLPLNNDWIMAEYLTRRIAEQVPAIILPTLQYGYYPSFLEYPGSVSLSLETSKNMIKEICSTLSRYGIKKFYVINTGISTLYALKPAQKELEERGVTLQYTDLHEVARAREVDGGIELEQEGGTHADESETSMMLYIKPEIVDMAKAVKDYNPLNGRGLTRDQYNKKAGVYSESGIYGDPTLATADKGKIIVESLVQHIVKEIETLIKE